MKIQVLFGSASDERVYAPLCQSLENVAKVTMEVASAHRHPARVREVVTTSEANAFVAGAGLAAHLPGVVASLTQKPVFGVAINGAFGGMDAFLSIAQMPKDIPVAAVMENQIELLPELLKRAKGYNQDKLELSWNPYRSEVPVLAKMIQDIRDKAGMEVTWVDPNSPQCQGELVMVGEKPQGKNLCMYICDKEELKNSNLANEFFAVAKSGGAWVGVNNITNFLLQIKKMKEALS
jgi:5-(carboxyamino)imidazole ribonucleotide mutase